MTKIPYEIPTEIRDLTAKSVEEARKAFGSFIEAAHKATAQAEGTTNALQSTAKDVSAKALSFTEANLKAAITPRSSFKRRIPRKSSPIRPNMVLKWLTLSLFAYFGTVMVVDIPWGEVARGLFIPTISASTAF